MDAPTIIQRLRERFPEAIVAAEPEALDPWAEVNAAALVDVCRWLRDDDGLRFNLLNLISGVDYFQPDAKLAAKTDWQPHVEVLYHMWSLVHKHRLVLRVRLPRWKDNVDGQLPELPSVSGVWRTADWHEREVFDLMGIRFVGHSDLRRILCAEDWVGHPLRKDYVVPEEYHGIRVR